MRSALRQVLLADPMPWAMKAEFAWDFLANRARFGGRYVGALERTPGWSFARASTGYAANSSGVLIPFSSGQLRRTDKGVLIEGARTNLALRSQEFDNASWLKSRATITGNAAVAPDGTNTADKLVDTSGLGTHRAYQNVTKAASAIQYTASAYFKAAERTFAQIRVSEAGEVNANGVAINLSDGTLSATYGSGFTGVSATSQSLGNGWYRLALTFTTATDTNVTMFLLPALGITASAPSYTGDDVSGVYVWGAQLEAASFPSSYIPTTTASATRAADSLTVTGVTELDYPLTLYAEWEPAAVVGSPQGTLQVDSASNDRALLTMSSGALAQMYVQDGGVDQVNNTIAGAIAVGTVYKHAVRFAANDSQHARGGTLGTQDTSCSMPSAPTTIRLGSQTSSTTALYGYLRRAAIYSRALTDAELQSLTT